MSLREPALRAMRAATLLLIAHVASAGAQAPLISTVLGAGNGDGGAASHAQLYSALSMAFDGAGNAYIADSYNDRVRKVAADGNISTVAGIVEHVFGTCADGPGATVPLAAPSAVAVDHNGNALIVDSYHECIRRLNADGTLTAIAGNGNYGFFGDGGQAIDANFSNPRGIAVDSHGNIYIADSGANRVRKIDGGGMINTVAGSDTTDYVGDGGDATSAGLNYPTGLAIDANDILYITDTFHYAIRKVDGNGKISTVAGTGVAGNGPGNGGNATDTQLSNPYGVAIAANGELYIADSGNILVRRVDAQGKIWNVAGGGNGGGYSPDGTPALGAQIGSVENVSFDNTGRLLIVGGARVLRVESDATLTTYAGGADYANATPAAAASLLFPGAAAADAAGNLYVADQFNGRVRRLNRDGSVDTVAGNGSLIFSGDGGPATAAGLANPSAVALDAAGNVYVAEYGRIRKIDGSGNIATFAGGGGTACGAHGTFGDVAGMAFDAHGTLYAADEACQYVYAIDTSGNVTPFAGTGTFGAGADGVPATQSALALPAAISIDSTGKVCVADMGSQRVREVDLNGIITTIAGDGTQAFGGDGGPATAAQLSSPAGLAFDRGGNLYVSDFGNSVVRKVGSDGIIHTIAGHAGNQGYYGDGGLATDALLAGPQGLVYDRGTLYIVDYFNSNARAVDLGEIFADGFEP